MNYLLTALLALAAIQSTIAASTIEEDSCLLRRADGLFERSPLPGCGFYCKRGVNGCPPGKREALAEDACLLKRADGLYECIPQCGYYCKRDAFHCPTPRRDEGEDNCLVRRGTGLFARVPGCGKYD